MYHLDDTIAAIASAPGGAARGIVRLSGPGVLDLVPSCFHPHSSTALYGIGRATSLAGSILLPAAGSGDAPATLPAELYLWPTERSYTRQPVAELHTLGSPPLLAALLRTLCAAGARVAEPGEFTLRAFLAGRLDLTQAEAVLGIIDAQGERALAVALEQLAGGLARPLTALRESLLDLLAELEAGLDFSEEDIEFISRDELDARLRAAGRTLADLARQMSCRTEVTEALRIVLVGWPNVGKSSLFNALAAAGQSDGPSALVSEQPGTTRDYLTAWLDAPGATSGRRCQLIDTAGIESPAAGNEPSGLAQQSTHMQAQRADLRLLCLEATRPLNAWERQRLATSAPGRQWIVLTKCDGPRQLELDRVGQFAGTVLETSSRTGAGVDRLREALLDHAAEAPQQEGSVVAATATRCGESLRLASDALWRAAEANTAGWGEELVAAEARVALAELGRVVGAVYTDDILDRIFSRFCIGK